MKFYNELLGKAGLSSYSKELTVSTLGMTLALMLVAYLVTGILGMGFCLGILFLAAVLEVIRIRADQRQRSFDACWPQVFDSFQSAALSGVGLNEQLQYLAKSGPEPLRTNFGNLAAELNLGRDLQSSLARFSSSVANRHADLLVLLITLESELGGVGMAESFEKAATQVRVQLSELGQLLAKQGWVSASAKLALLAPWLIAIVLIQLPQNKAAFATELGAVVLVTGLALSLVAYALVNRLGYLPLPKRVLDGS
ncbi:MAG: hypothetical protein RL068_323 [Actinomycetota bacterium]|jgi:tight adherence protein B